MLYEKIHDASTRLHGCLAPNVPFSKPCFTHSQAYCTFSLNKSDVTSAAVCARLHSRLRSLLVFARCCITSISVCSLCYVTSKASLPLQWIAENKEMERAKLHKVAESDALPWTYLSSRGSFALDTKLHRLPANSCGSFFRNKST
jgi:hypothetical protein